MSHPLSHDEELVRRLPLPLAQLYRRAQNAKTALERHLTSYYLWEAGIKLLGAVALVEYAELDHVDEQLQQRLHNVARPALGHWWEFLRRLVPILADKNVPGFVNLRQVLLGPARGDLPRTAGLDGALREILENKPQARATVRLTELIDRLVAYRNRELGHGAAGQRGVDFYEKMSRVLLGAAAEFFDKIDIGNGGSLQFLGEVRRQSSGAWLVERFDLEGENARRLESLQWPEDDLAHLPHPERVYLQRAVSEEGRGTSNTTDKDSPRATHTLPTFLSLHPLVIFDRDTGEFLFLNARRGKQRTEFLSYTTGRVVDRQDLGEEQRALLIRILGLEVSTEQARAWAVQSQAEEADTETDARQDKTALATRTIGEFELLSELGRGGMGVVYRAWQPSLERQVALKCLMRSGDPKAEARFAREIRALGSVEHPNLVKIFTSGSEKDQWFYAMEIVDGATLGAVCDRFTPTVTAAQVNMPDWRQNLKSVCSDTRQAEKPLSTPGNNGMAARPMETAAVPDTLSEPQYYTHMVKLVRQVAEAAHALHKVGIIHRDIKPGNIMVNTEGTRAVLMDLGLAQLADDIEGRLTRTRQFVGTLRYASPEQILAIGKLDARSDVYSLGATLWELLTLRPLFGADENMPTPELMQRIQFQEPGLLRRFNPRIPIDIEAIVGKCLEKSPSRRYGSCRELADELDRFLEGKPVKARPVGGLERAWRWCRRRPAIAGLAAALLVAVVAGFALVTWKWREAEQNLVLAEDARVKAQALQLTAENRKEALAKQTVKLEAQTEQLQKNQQELQKSNDKLKVQAETMEKILQDLKRVYYLQTIPLAYANPARAEDMINPLAPQFRGWEWYYLKRRHQAPFFSWRKHAGTVLALAYSGDGRWLASGGESRDLFLRNGFTGEIEWSRRDQPNTHGVAFSPDGKNFATANADAVRIWDLAKKEVVFTFKNHGGKVAQVAFHPKEPLAASLGFEKKVYVWNYRTGAVQDSFEGAGNYFAGLAFSPDGKLLAAVAPNNNVVVRDVAGRTVKWTLTGHTKRVNQVAFSPDGKWLASASNDKSVILWDLQTGKSARVLQGHTNLVVAVAFHPAGKMLASASWDLTVKLWDVDQGKEIKTLMGHTQFAYNLAFAPDGKYLASSGADRVENIWELDWAQDARVLTEANTPLQDLAFHPDKRHLVTAGFDSRLKVWDTLTGKIEQTLDESKEGLGTLAISGDGKWLAAGTGFLSLSAASKSSSIMIWDWERRQKVQELVGHEKAVVRLAFRPGHPQLASASRDKTVKIWDLASGKERTLKGHKGEVWSVAYSADGKMLASAGFDKTIQLWDAESGEIIGVLKGHARPIRALAFHPTQPLLASGGDVADSESEILLWDLADKKVLGRLTGHAGNVTSLAFHPDGTRLVSSSDDFTVKIWDPSTLLEVLSLRQHQDNVRAVAFSPDGELLASVGIDSKLVIWDGTPTHQLFRLTGHTGTVNCASFSPDGATLATTSHDRSVRLWNTASGVQLATFAQVTAPNCVKYSADGKSLIVGAKGIHILELPSGQDLKTIDGDQEVYFVAFNPRAPVAASTGADCAIKLWDSSSWSLRQNLPGHTKSVMSMAFSPDGQLLASASKDKTVKIWDVIQGTEILSLEGHTDGVQEVAFHPDGVHLASASQDRTVRIWDVKTGKVVRVLVGHMAKVWSVAFHAQGDFLMSADNLGVLKVWDFASGKETASFRAHAGSIGFVTYSKDGRLFATVSQDFTAQLWSGAEAWQEERRASPLFLPRVPEGPESQSFPADPFEKMRWQTWFRTKAREAMKVRDWAEADFQLTLLHLSDPGGTAPLLDRAETLVRMGKLREAVEILARFVPLDASLDNYWSGLACLHLKMGNVFEYRGLCQQLCKKHLGNRKTALSLGWTCALADAIQDLEPVVKTLEEEIKTRSASPVYLSTLGALYYRTGRWKSAQESLNDAILRQRRFGGFTHDILFLAMTNFRLGQKEEARKLLSEALRADRPSDLNVSWQYLLESELLRQEARNLIDPAVKK